MQDITIDYLYKDTALFVGRSFLLEDFSNDSTIILNTEACGGIDKAIAKSIESIQQAKRFKQKETDYEK